MAKAKAKEIVGKRTLLYIILAIIVIAVILIIVFSVKNKGVTGEAVSGVSVSNPKKSSSGYSISFDLVISKDATKKLKASSDTLWAAAAITDAVNQANGLANDGLKSLLGLPSVPDVYGVLAGIASWLNNNADQCLRDIGTKYNGKEFRGKYYYSVSKGQGSSWYPDWEYYYAMSTYTNPDGFNCKQKLGCVFSYNRKTKEISKSCFG